MKSLKEPFDLIKSGQKHIEIRLYDEKRKNLKVNDSIVFLKSPDCKDKVKVKVTHLARYSSLSELFNQIPSENFGWDSKSIDWMLNKMYKIYTKDQENKYGIIAISIQLI